MDRQYQAGIDGLKYAAEKSISLVIMEPIKGGKLSKASDDILEVWNNSDIKRTPAEWALKWVYNFPEVSVVLSGMSTIEQVKENIEITDNSLPKSLTKREHELIDKVTNIYTEKTKVGCTSCEYCLPCPQGVVIPEIFSLYNNYYVYGTEEQSISSYTDLIEKEKDSSKCIECGECEQLCPQHLKIISFLKDAEQALSK